MNIRKLVKSKLFLAIVFVVLILAGYSIYHDVSYAVEKFYSTGSESFATLPQSAGELPTVSNVLYTLSSENKDSRSTNANVFIFFYLAVISIVASFRATKSWVKRGKKIVLRIFSFVFGPIIGFAGMLLFVLLPSVGIYPIASFAILRKADAAARELTVKMKSEEGRGELGIISNEEEIIKRIKENPAVPAIINDDDSFTNNLIIAVATIGKDKTAFEAVAIPQAVWRNSGKNALLKELGADQLLLPGHTLAIRDLTPEFGRRILPIIAEKIIRQNKLINAKILESGKTAPKYVFLTVEDYRKLREAQTEKRQQEFIDTINVIKSRLAQGGGDRALLRQRLTEWEDAYQIFLAHPVGTLSELGTVVSGTVEVLLVDENDIPSDIPGYTRYFLSPFTTTVHELMHYYSGNKAELPSSLEEAMTSYYEKSLSGGTKILADSNLSLDYFSGYPEEKKIIEELARGISEADLAALYFSGNEERFAGIFEQKYALSYEDFIRRLDAIFHASSAEEGGKLSEELMAKLKK